MLKQKKRSSLVLVLSAFLVAVLVAADQLLKWCATTWLAPVGQADLLPGILGLRYVLNDGAAFSSFSGSRWLLVIITAASLIAVAVWMAAKRPSGLLYWFGILVLSGGVGNLIDRIRTGVVVDYLEFRFMQFPVFNLADILVCTAMGLLILYTILDTLKEHRSNAAQKDAVNTDGQA